MRAVRTFLLFAVLMGIPLWCLAEDVTGPAPIGTNVTRPPVVVGGVAYPSPDASPVVKGKADRIATDGAGAVWVKVLGSITSSISNLLTADSDTSANTTPGAGVLLLAPAAGGAVAMPGDAANGLAVQLYAGGSAVATGDGNGMKMQGIAAHDAATTGAPLLNGGYAHATGTLPSAVSADGDAARILVDRYGRPRVSLESPTGLEVADASGLIVHGPVAHDGDASSSIPLITGAVAGNTLPGAVSADNDAVRVVATRQGQLRTITDDNANAVGHSVKYEASHAGGATEVTAKASAGVLKWIRVANPNTTDVFLQLHDAANPTIGSATPLDSICIPGGTGANNRGIMNQEFGPVGITFATALTYTVTTTAEGSTAPTSAVTVSIGYK